MNYRKQYDPPGYYLAGVCAIALVIGFVGMLTSILYALYLWG